MAAPARSSAFRKALRNIHKSFRADRVVWTAFFHQTHISGPRIAELSLDDGKGMLNLGTGLCLEPVDLIVYSVQTIALVQCTMPPSRPRNSRYSASSIAGCDRANLCCINRICGIVAIGKSGRPFLPGGQMRLDQHKSAPTKAQHAASPREDSDLHLIERSRELRQYTSTQLIRDASKIAERASMPGLRQTFLKASFRSRNAHTRRSSRCGPRTS
ncbi:hypothetical protein OKW34_003225 [Paraburkholderia youngii]